GPAELDRARSAPDVLPDGDSLGWALAGRFEARQRMAYWWPCAWARRGSAAPRHRCPWQDWWALTAWRHGPVAARARIQSDRRLRRACGAGPGARGKANIYHLRPLRHYRVIEVLRASLPGRVGWRPARLL